MHKHVTKLRIKLVAAVALASSFGQCASIALAEDMVLGGDVTVAENYLRSELGSTPVLLSACAGHSATGADVVYVLVSELSRRRGFILELNFAVESKWVISNVGELSIEKGKPRVVEANGGIATYQHLALYAESLGRLKQREVETIQLLPWLENGRRCCALLTN